MARFIDRVVLHLQAGDGGHGCVSVHREKFKPLGGPDAAMVATAVTSSSRSLNKSIRLWISITARILRRNAAAMEPAICVMVLAART